MKKVTHLTKTLVAVCLMLVVAIAAFRHTTFPQLVWERLLEYGRPIVATAIAIWLLAIILAVLGALSRNRTTRSPDPIDTIVHLLRNVTGSRQHTARRISDSPLSKRRLLNVQCRLKDGTLFTKNFVPVVAHNGSGGVYPIDRGVFFGCDAEHIDVGSHLTICVGRLRFELTVKLDDEKEVPYVVIPHTRRDLIALLNASEVLGE